MPKRQSGADALSAVATGALLSSKAARMPKDSVTILCVSIFVTIAIRTYPDYDKRQLKKGEIVVALKNILTSPSKKGTYGFVGTNIGGNPEGINGEFKYSSEPPKTRAQTAGEKPSFVPFVPSSPAKKGTYGYMQLNINGAKNPAGVNGEYTYATQGVSSARREKVVSDQLKPFYPSQPPKRGGGYYGTMRWKGQEYIDDPEQIKCDKMMAERKGNREKYGNLVFRPSGVPKSLRTSSVANHPRNQDGGHPAAQNAKLFLSRRNGAGA